MMICVQCAREMRCVKTGVSADFGEGHCYAGDQFLCPGCLVQVIKANDAPHFDPEHIHHDVYLMIRHP